MPPLEEIERRCRASVLTGLQAAERIAGRVDGVYGSGARFICTPRGGEVDLNVFRAGEPAKLLFRGPRLTLVALSLPHDTDPMREYPQPGGGSYLPIGAVLAWHATPLTDTGRELIKRVVGRMGRGDRILTAKAALWKAYELALGAERAKDLVRAACDLAPYALRWLRRPDDVPSLYQRSVRDVIDDEELLSLCARALEAKAYGAADLEGLRRRIVEYLTRVGAHRYKGEYEELRRRMKPWLGSWRPPVTVEAW